MPETLTHRTVKNSIYSLIGFVWPLLLAFLVMPIIIKSLGSARFGFYSLLNSVLMLFGLLDFGLSYTFVKLISEDREHQSSRELSVIFSTTTILYAILGIIAMALLILLKGKFRFWFNIPEGFISSYGLAFFILGATFFMKMLTVPISQIPYALQRQDIGTKISFVNSILLGVGSVLVLKTGHGILSLLVIQLISAAFLFLCFYFVWHRLAPDLKFIPALSKKVLKTIGQQSFWLFIRNNMVNVLAQLDKFVLGVIWGPTAVGYYSTAQMIPEKISSTSFSLSHMFFPIFSEVSSKEQEGSGRIKAIFRRSLGIISVVTAGLTVVVLLYGYKLISFWVNQDFADQAAVAMPVLALTYFLLSFGNFIQSFLSGLKELKFLALSIMLLALVDVIFMFILIPRYSLNGAALAYLLGALPIPMVVYFIERKYFTSQASEIILFYAKLFGKMFLAAFLIFALGWFVIYPFATNLLLTMVLGALSFALYLLFYWAFGFFEKEDEDLAKAYGRIFLGYFKRI
ncbi:MAG: oligosaccharide flippase family protein [Patescibacteria group bacterium]